MGPLHSPKEYLFNLHTTSSGEARRIWKQKIKEEWNYKCAYCGSEENLTIDHVIPQSKGGSDFTKNVVCCCQSCNQNKGHTPWQEWYFRQDFFTEEKRNAILKWITYDSTETLYRYRPRRNNAS